MQNKECPTFVVRIEIAGDYDIARQICRAYCYDKGFCVKVEKVDYIYTGGEESGISVQCINYPRFPKKEEELIGRALDLADLLREKLFQHSYCVITPTKTIWSSKREES